MKTLFDMLRVKEQELAKVKAQCQRLEAEVSAIRLTAKLLSDGEVAQEPQDTKGGPSQVQMIRFVLQDHGTPMHMKDIAEAVKRKYGKRLNTTMMAAVIYRYGQRNKTFYKDHSRPNTWGLLEWQIAKNPSLPLGVPGKAVQ